jgi:hypothetical protein
MEVQLHCKFERDQIHVPDDVVASGEDDPR